MSDNLFKWYFVKPPSLSPLFRVISLTSLAITGLVSSLLLFLVAKILKQNQVIIPWIDEYLCMVYLYFIHTYIYYIVQYDFFVSNKHYCLVIPFFLILKGWQIRVYKYNLHLWDATLTFEEFSLYPEGLNRQWGSVKIALSFRLKL